jgi:hypothetical protein
MLNDMMVKNKYPLLLISELVNQLRGAKYFTKLDVRWCKGTPLTLPHTLRLPHFSPLPQLFRSALD